LAIRQTLEELRAAPELHDAEIIVVNDGSTDRTEERARAVAGVRVISHRSNLGYGGAIKTAVRVTEREYVFWYDADGQHRVEDLVRLVRLVQEEDADWGLGVRGESSHQSFGRKPGKLLLRLAVRLAARKKVPDFNSGLRGFRTQLLKIYLHLLPNGFSASTTTSLLMIERGYRCVETTIQTNKRVGSSQVRQIRDGLRTLTLILRIFLLFRAMAFFFVLGGLVFFTGAVYSSWVMAIKHLGVPIAGLLVMMTGILTIFMGLIADQLSLIRRERFEDLDDRSRHVEHDEESQDASESGPPPKAE
jgi:glycosyltransferase involved in cell wall biosynthesis